MSKLQSSSNIYVLLLHFKRSLLRSRRWYIQFRHHLFSFQVCFLFPTNHTLLFLHQFIQFSTFLWPCHTFPPWFHHLTSQRQKQRNERKIQLNEWPNLKRNSHNCLPSPFCCSQKLWHVTKIVFMRRTWQLIFFPFMRRGRLP